MTRRGGGVLVIRDQHQGWIIESTHFHGTNVVSCEVVTDKRTLLIGRYLPPSTLFHLTDLEEAFTRFCDQDPIVIWDLNIYIQSHNPLSQQVAGILMKFGMVDLCHHLGTTAAPTH